MEPVRRTWIKKPQPKIRSREKKPLSEIKPDITKIKEEKQEKITPSNEENISSLQNCIDQTSNVISEKGENKPKVIQCFKNERSPERPSATNSLSPLLKHKIKLSPCLRENHTDSKNFNTSPSSVKRELFPKKNHEKDNEIQCIAVKEIIKIEEQDENNPEESITPKRSSSLPLSNKSSNQKSIESSVGSNNLTEIQCITIKEAIKIEDQIENNPDENISKKLSSPKLEVDTSSIQKPRESSLELSDSAEIQYIEIKENIKLENQIENNQDNITLKRLPSSKPVSDKSSVQKSNESLELVDVAVSNKSKLSGKNENSNIQNKVNVNENNILLSYENHSIQLADNNLTSKDCIDHVDQKANDTNYQKDQNYEKNTGHLFAENKSKTDSFQQEHSKSPLRNTSTTEDTITISPGLAKNTDNSNSTCVDKNTDLPILTSLLTSKKRAENKEIANKRKRYAKGQNPPERSKMTMMDLIYWNPSGSPMKNTTKDRVLTEIPVPSQNEDVDDPSNNIEASDNTNLPAPRLIVGENGEITIDEESLIISRTAPAIDATDIIYEESNTTYSSFRKYSIKRGWTKKETILFYRALSIVGTDFTLMESMLPNRTRREIKLKYKREEKCNREFMDTILYKHKFDITAFENEEIIDQLLENEVIDSPQKMPKKRGKKRKVIIEDNNSSDDATCKMNKKQVEKEVAILPNKVPKKRGRKRKVQVITDDDLEEVIENSREKQRNSDDVTDRNIQDDDNSIKDIEDYLEKQRTYDYDTDRNLQDDDYSVKDIEEYLEKQKNSDNVTNRDIQVDDYSVKDVEDYLKKERNSENIIDQDLQDSHNKILAEESDNIDKKFINSINVNDSHNQVQLNNEHLISFVEESSNEQNPITSQEEINREILIPVQNQNEINAIHLTNNEPVLIKCTPEFSKIEIDISQNSSKLTNKNFPIADYSLSNDTKNDSENNTISNKTLELKEVSKNSNKSICNNISSGVELLAEVVSLTQGSKEKESAISDTTLESLDNSFVPNELVPDAMANEIVETDDLIIFPKRTSKRKKINENEIKKVSVKRQKCKPIIKERTKETVKTKDIPIVNNTRTKNIPSFNYFTPVEEYPNYKEKDLAFTPENNNKKYTRQKNNVDTQNSPDHLISSLQTSIFSPERVNSSHQITTTLQTTNDQIITIPLSPKLSPDGKTTTSPGPLVFFAKSTDQDNIVHVFMYNNSLSPSIKEEVS